jgi:hypothetical protein
VRAVGLTCGACGQVFFSEEFAGTISTKPAASTAPAATELRGTQRGFATSPTSINSVDVAKPYPLQPSFLGFTKLSRQNSCGASYRPAVSRQRDCGSFAPSSRGGDPPLRRARQGQKSACSQRILYINAHLGTHLGGRSWRRA